MRLVLIDDDVRSMNILGQMLQASGFTITAFADNARAGLDAVHQTQPDVILTDLEMPDMNGIQMTTVLRSLGDATPVILMTGSTDHGLTSRAQSAGVSAFVPKPLNIDHLVQMLSRAATQLRSAVA